MGSAVRSKKMAVSEPSLGMTALDYSLPPCGGGLGRGVAARLVLVVTPLSNSPPQGGREQTERVATATMDSIFHTAEVDRHCERSEAIHRAAQRKNGLLRFARNDVELQTRFRDLAARCARGFAVSSAQRGRGERRMPLAPAASCALGSDRTHTSNNEYPGITRRSRTQWFYGLFRALPGDRALLPPSPCGLKVLSSPVEPNEPPQDLTPASRRQDHTTSPSASSAVVLHAANRSRRAIRPALASHAQHCCVHRTPPRVRDDHDTPLWWGGMREF